jgi:hypothetical protein
MLKETRIELATTLGSEARDDESWLYAAGEMEE